MKKLHLRDIPTVGLDKLFDLILQYCPVPIFDPVSQVNLLDFYNFQIKKRMSLQHSVKLASDWSLLSQLSGELREIESQIISTEGVGWDYVSLSMRHGVWIALGMINRRLVMIPNSHWRGTLNRAARTLTYDGRTYRDLQIVCPDAGQEQHQTIDYFYKKVNHKITALHLDQPSSILKAGRPSASGLISLRWEELVKSQNIPPTLAAAAQLISDWLARTHPDAPPAGAKTIQKQISRRFREVSAGRTPSSQLSPPKK